MTTNGNKPFFIKYLDNNPVKIQTHYVLGTVRIEHLRDVADLIEAYKSISGSLLANTDSGLISLYSIDNDVEQYTQCLGFAR